ncbi:MAG: MarR family transcriptional regulator [Anaerolineaceae bacterium]|jgi:MarR family 2-MHQ and catechol resistance regulon transcriptional repressor
MPTHYKGSPETTLALDTYIKLTRANSAFEARLLAHGDLGNLTITQFGVLEALFHLGPQCQGVISQKLLKSTGNMTLVIDNLEKLGLVRRNRTLEDRRQVLIELTAQGEALIKTIFPRQAEAIRQEMSVLSLEEQQALGRLLRKLGQGRNKET